MHMRQAPPATFLTYLAPTFIKCRADYMQHPRYQLLYIHMNTTPMPTVWIATTSPPPSRDILLDTHTPVSRPVPYDRKPHHHQSFSISRQPSTLARTRTAKTRHAPPTPLTPTFATIGRCANSWCMETDLCQRKDARKTARVESSRVTIHPSTENASQTKGQLAALPLFTGDRSLTARSLTLGRYVSSRGVWRRPNAHRMASLRETKRSMLSPLSHSSVSAQMPMPMYCIYLQKSKGSDTRPSLIGSLSFLQYTTGLTALRCVTLRFGFSPSHVPPF